MQTVTIPQALEIALQNHRTGRLAEAETIYRQILAQDPNHADALHLLGALAQQVGRHDVAIDFIRRAIAAKPLVADFHSNLGVALDSSGQTDEAIAEFRKALKLRPDYASAHCNLGNALRNKGQFDEAIAECRVAIQLDPLSATTFNNLGNALKNKGQFEEAIAAFHKAIALQPGYAEAHFNLGNTLKDHGKPEEAIAAYRRSLAIKPDFVHAHINMGNTLRDAGRMDEAIDECRRAIEIRPDLAEAHNNLGVALSGGGRIDEAIAAFRRAIELQPDLMEAHNNLGNLMTDHGSLDEAVAACSRAIEIKPDYAEAHNNLGNGLKAQGRLDEAIAAYRRAQQLKPDNATVHSNLLLFLHNLPDLDARSIFEEHRRWDELHARPLAKLSEPYSNSRDPERRLRIGYVSPDFREHSVAFFIESLLASHDRDQVEVFCYADLARPDAFTARLQQHAGRWRKITSMSDAQVAELIRQDCIDILVDLSGHTARNRLLAFARKPAPIQVTWLGYPDTTGMGSMDYRFTDAHADPPSTSEHLHSERLIRLPEIFACFRPAEDSPPVKPLPALARGYVTFASFHTQAKLNERLLERWAEILLRVPNSRLLMAANGLNEVSSQRRLVESFASNGVEAERLEFKGRQPLPQYLALHNEVDLLLDSFPFAGHTISCHALWMGVPVVTLAGDRHCARMVASVLTNLGLPDLIAQTRDEYVNIASALAGDMPRLAELRSALRERMHSSPVMDAPHFARGVEQAYREMWRSWCANPS